ncbi:MAG: PAS domain S-box protein [SAR324 cluster bacterium]|nr:PAS domain S-box protein [SAR324 cluster bacterium]
MKDSILFRLIIFSALLVITTGVGIGYISNDIYQEAFITEKLGHLEEENHQQSLHLVLAIQTLRSDIAFLSKMPPIQGIIRTQKAGGTDPHGGATEEVWNNHLTIIFQEFLAVKPEYIQVRYIGLADQGRELVRVEKQESSVQVIPQKRLQQKLAEPYMQEVLQLKPGQIYLSKINLNRENGKIVEPHQPVIRVATPIYAETGKIFGVVVINMSMQSVFAEIQNSIHSSISPYLVNNAGHYLFHPDPKLSFAFELGKASLIFEQIPQLKKMFVSENLDQDLVFIDKQLGKAIHFHKILFDPSHPERFLGLLLETSTEDFLADAHVLEIQSFTTVLILIFLGCLIAYAIVYRLIYPLKSITESANMVAEGNYDIELSFSKKGEVGTLAHAFKVMIGRIKRRTEMLEENEARTHAIVHTAVDAIITISERGMVDSFNQAAENMFGYTQEEVIGQNVNMLMPSPDREQHDGYLDNYLKTGNAKIIGIGRVVTAQRKDGSVFPIELSVSEVHFKKTRMFTGIIKDLTQQKMMEAELRTNEEKYRILFQTMLQGVVYQDAQGQIIDANPAAEKTLGLSIDQMKGVSSIDPRWQTIHEDGSDFPGETHPAMAALHTGEHVKDVIMGVFHPQEDQYRWILINAIPLFKEDEKQPYQVYTTFTDITERRQMDLYLLEAKEKAEAASLAKSQFLANMSHEIRTPLNAIVGFSQILLNHKDQQTLPQDFKDYLKSIDTAGKNLSELINNILDLSKIESGKMTHSEESLNLKQLFMGIYYIHRSLAREKNLQYTYQLDPELPEFINSDRTKLNQILTNLVSNAIKFTATADRTETKKVSLRASKKEGMLLLQVIDEGIGIPEEQQSTIFEAFEQADGSITRRFGGTGLGLSITKRMVELLGGRMEVKSKPDEGSTFSVWIPLKTASVVVVQKLTTTHNFSKDNVILVVEDNPMNQQMITTMLESFGGQIHLANNGGEGIQKAIQLEKKGTPPDLILMDIHMPGMDGITATQRLQQLPQLADIPVVALSADAFNEQQKAARASGMTDYLTKPVDQEKLIEVLAAYLKQDHLQKTKPEAAAPVKQPVCPLPDSLRRQLLEELEELEKFPVYYVNEIVKLAEKMMGMCEGKDVSCSADLNTLMEAVSQGNEKSFLSSIADLKNSLGNSGMKLPRASELLLLLEEEIRPDWEALCEVVIIDEVEEFAKKIQSMGNEYQYPTLEKWGDDLLLQAHSFDVERLNRTLQTFPEICQTVKSFI